MDFQHMTEGLDMCQEWVGCGGEGIWSIFKIKLPLESIWNKNWEKMKVMMCLPTVPPTGPWPARWEPLNLRSPSPCLNKLPYKVSILENVQQLKLRYSREWSKSYCSLRKDCVSFLVADELSLLRKVIKKNLFGIFPKLELMENCWPVFYHKHVLVHFWAVLWRFSGK